MPLMSSIIKERLVEAKAPWVANANISQHIHSKEELELLVLEVTRNVQALLSSLVIDTANDHNTNETAKRVAKSLVLELFSGRYQPMPAVTDFPNVTNFDGLYVVGPIAITSMCSHHMLPIQGKAWIGIYPSDRVIGLSKFNRLADWICRRPQIQEELTNQIADLLDEVVKPKGSVVIVKASHMCCGMRGVEDKDSMMTTSVIRGCARDNPNIKSEFLSLVALN